MSRIAHKFRPKPFKSFWLMLCREYKLHWHHKNQIVQGTLFFLMAITICKFTINELSTNLLLILLFFSSIYSLSNILSNDFQKNILEQFTLLGINMGWILAAKLIAYITIIGIPFAAIVATCHYLLISEDNFGFIMVISLLTIINISIILIFTSSICLEYSQNIILTIFSMLFIIPTMIFSSLAMHDCSYINTLVAIFSLESAIFISATAFVIRSVIRS